jgi:uncharacterized protein (TIRG00374 family)
VIIKKLLRYLGFSLGLFFLILAFSKVNWGDFVAAIQSIQPLWVVLSAVSLLMAMLLRSLRWHLITGLPRADFIKVLDATCIGYLGVIYPARAGELLRMIRLKQLTKMGGGLAIGSAVVDRVLEGLALCILLLFIVITWNGKLEARQGLVGMASIFFLMATGLVFFVTNGHRFIKFLQFLNRLGSFGERLIRWYEECLAGLQILRSPQRASFALAIQVLVTLFDLLTCWFLFKAFGWDLPFVASIIVLVYLISALSLPALPGYVGVYQVATLFALRSYEINSTSAVAYGTVMQVITLILFVSAGFWAQARSRKAHDANNSKTA